MELTTSTTTDLSNLSPVTLAALAALDHDLQKEDGISARLERAQSRALRAGRAGAGRGETGTQRDGRASLARLHDAEAIFTSGSTFSSTTSGTIIIATCSRRDRPAGPWSFTARSRQRLQNVLGNAAPSRSRRREKRRNENGVAEGGRLPLPARRLPSLARLQSARDDARRRARDERRSTNESSSLLAIASGGAIKVERGGMQGAAAHAGQYAGRSKGNFRIKAALESLGNLIHNEMAFLPGQTGKDRQHAPEQLHGLLKHNDALLLGALADFRAARAMDSVGPLHAPAIPDHRGRRFTRG
jgi:hypothetical protein